MSEGSNDDKTEEPTARKLSKAREDGQVARSRDLGHFAAVAGGTQSLHTNGFDEALVMTLDGLIEGMPLLTRVPLPARSAARKTVGVVTTTGGGAGGAALRCHS